MMELETLTGKNDGRIITATSVNWQQSPQPVGNRNGNSFGKALEHVAVADPNAKFVAYNNKPPNAVGVQTNSNSKGILIMDPTPATDSAAWIIHTVPGFPKALQDYTFPAEEIAKGHLFVCLTIKEEQLDVIVLPDPDVSEPDTVSEDELDHTFQQSNSSIYDEKATQSLYSNLATTAAEIEVLIGMLITMGVCEMPRYRMYWANQTHYDRFYEIRPLIESIRKTCLEETPGELQSVDEHIIPYKGRCKMKYYNPRKPDKWGLKVIARCGKNAFVHDFWMCDGMAPKVENSIGFFAADVVIKVCETLPKHKGDGIHSGATIQSNRLRGCPVMPSNELKGKGRGASDFCCTRDNKLCVVKWFDNREVILASTYKCVDPVQPVRRWDKRQRQFIDIPCPQIVKEYN
ncbi:PiggyBac transposable element-derived protein 3 [Trichinella britovi]|uniref:PiggyBac transposable element-derived protein 3 n=1 Tax=Trichinella britovi TaxID=45882 RepID=A0A0V1CQP2_TRIBR|nr:PiggyBac transposable element-derived protein 3 [Trichinella britovi]